MIRHRSFFGRHGWIRFKKDAICWPTFSIRSSPSYWDQNLQIVFVANGDYQMIFRDIVNHHNFHKRVAIYDFSNSLEHLAYGASDFILMPSSFEPCGLPQMIAPIYGTLPVAHDTGGIHDTVTDLNVKENTGNGFLFKNFDPNGLLWAIRQAMSFYNLPRKKKRSRSNAL